MQRQKVLALFFFGLLWWFSVPARAANLHEERFTLTGVVRDSGGKNLAGVEITAVNLNTKELKSGKTDEAGTFTVKGLAAGRYRVTATLTCHGDEARAGKTVTTAQVETELSEGRTGDVRITMKPIPCGDGPKQKKKGGFLSTLGAILKAPVALVAKAVPIGDRTPTKPKPKPKPGGV